MGFFRRLFGAKKKPTTQTPASKPPKRRWTFAKHPPQPQPQPPSSALNHHYDPSSSSLDANKHAIAVAAATAAVAEAALAAAHAAAEVVRLTSAGAPPTTPTTTSRPNVSSAAVKIQSAFRGYLARRALRALKALVKLQALVRGHIVRKQTADMLRRMQTLVRLQAQARATRVFSHTNMNTTMHSFKPSLSRYYPVPEEYSTKFDGSSILKRCSSNANFRERGARFGSSWLERWMKERENRDEDEEKMSDKILEVDTWKPPLRSMKGKEEVCSRTADNSPQTLLSSSSSRRQGGPFTPTRSECSFHGYAGHPNYMSNTHSSRAKVRSQSAPRQRLDYDRYGYACSNNTLLHYHSHLRSKVSSSRFNRIGVTNLR